MDNKKSQGFHPGHALLGGLLILLGIVFLVGELFDIRIGSFLWPFFIIGPGVALFVLSLAVADDTGQGLSAVSGLITMVGLILFFQNVTGSVCPKTTFEFNRGATLRIRAIQARPEQSKGMQSPLIRWFHWLPSLSGVGLMNEEKETTPSMPTAVNENQPIIRAICVIRCYF
jgi:membrane-bound ClpP family serine protease